LSVEATPYPVVVATDEGSEHAAENVWQTQERLAAASLNPVEGTLREILAIVKRLEGKLDELERHD